MTNSNCSKCGKEIREDYPPIELQINGNEWESYTAFCSIECVTEHCLDLVPEDFFNQAEDDEEFKYFYGDHS